MAERTPIVPAGISPNPALSPGIRVGEWLFISGSVANDASGTLVGPGDCEAQSRQVMTNIKTIAEAAGASMADVVKITCFLTDVANYGAYGRVRSEFFPQDPPASSTVIVAGLVRPEYLVEVEAIVRVPGDGS